jgi:hypothetical protein
VVQIGRALLEAVSLSVSAELQRRMDAAAAAAAARSSDDVGDADGRASEALRCADVCRTVRELLHEEYVWTRWALVPCAQSHVCSSQGRVCGVTGVQNAAC